MVYTLKTNALHRLMITEGKSYTYKKGQLIHSTDGRLELSLIKSGFVLRYQISNNGSINIQSIYGKNDFYPLSLAFKLLFNRTLYGGPETIFYEALSETEIYSLGNDLFVKAVKDEPVLYQELLIEAGKRLSANIQKIENIAMANSEKRVAHQLLYYAIRFGKIKTNGSTQLDLPLTHAVLASSLSLTRETVSQCIGSLRKRGLIKARRQSFLIPNLQKLEAFAYK
jgi:CRP-like cAMP-binding protein